MIGDVKIAKQNYSVARVVTHNKDDSRVYFFDYPFLFLHISSLLLDFQLVEIWLQQRLIQKQMTCDKNISENIS